MATFHPDPGPDRNRRQGIGALVFLGLALVMTYLPPAQQQEVRVLLRSSVLRPFIATQQVVSRTRVQTRDASVLRSRLDSLAALLTNQTTLAEENRRLRELLDLERRIGVDYRAAGLLRPGTEGSESMFLLDLDGMDSVRAGAPVIAPEGLVGVVREIGSGGAIGMDWTHPDFRASAMTRDGTTYGIVEPAQGDGPGTDVLLLTGTPFTTTLETGTWIVTSGRGGVYPRGIPIGRISGLAEAEGGWRKTYSVDPAVQLGAVTHALVGVGETTLPMPGRHRVGAGSDSSAATAPSVGARSPGGDSGAPPARAGGAGVDAEGERPVRDLRPIMLPRDSSEAEPDELDGDGADESVPEPPPNRAPAPAPAADATTDGDRDEAPEQPERADEPAPNPVEDSGPDSASDSPEDAGPDAVPDSVEDGGPDAVPDSVEDSDSGAGVGTPSDSGDAAVADSVAADREQDPAAFPDDASSPGGR